MFSPRLHRAALPLLAAGFLCAPCRAEDCARCTDKALCAPHKTEEATALSAFAKAFKDKSAGVRIAALRELAMANAAHENHRSATAAQKMSAGLRDADPEVRRETARLLGTTQESRAACQALIAPARAALQKIGGLDPAQAWQDMEYADDLSWLEALLGALAATRDRAAGAVYAAGFDSGNFDAVRLAAQNCTHLRTGAIVGGLVATLQRIVSTKQSTAGNAAWRAVSDALPMASGEKSIAPQGTGAGDAYRFCREWQEWWKANKGKPEFR